MDVSGTTSQTLYYNGANWVATSNVTNDGTTVTTTKDIIVNGIKIGRGTGNHSENTVIGSEALGTGTGQRNTAVGRLALRNYEGTSFDNNTAIGYNNSSKITTGQQNTSIGAEALMQLTTGTANTAIGAQSLINTTGPNNTALGYAAGQVVTTGSNNTFLGKSANGSSTGLINSTAIGYEAIVTENNTIQLGNASVSNIKTSGTITAGAITIPNTDGENGEVLTTNGSGTLSWTKAPPVGNAAGQMLYWNGSAWDNY